MAVFLISACGETEAELPRLREDRDAFGLITCSGQTETTTCRTHRAVIGVSMGASGAGQIGLSHPELFDTIGMLGISAVDWVYMLRVFERSYLGGFCDRETILANLDAVNDPNGSAWCGPVPGVERQEPSGTVIEPSMDFNHWWLGSRGSGAIERGRDWIRSAFQDIALAYGNPLYHNAESPYFPPGVPNDLRARADRERCNPSPVIRGLFHREYNPTGEHDVIVACDTATIAGDFDPRSPADTSFEILLAVDYNQNGVRDFAEPVLTMAHERYRDEGTSPGDTYDPFQHPRGTAGNWLHDEGESFDDDGLDGVPNTADYGEGNGRFDYTPAIRDRLFPQNPRFLVETIAEEQLDRISIYADAGIRDFLGSAGGTNWMWGALQTRIGGERARDYDNFATLPSSEPSSSYNFLAVDYRPETLGQHVYLRYGDPQASESVIRQGDGDHVGTIGQALDRLLTAVGLAEARFYERDRRVSTGELDIDRHLVRTTYPSSVLGGERAFSIALPPGYFDETNAEQKYPVVYLLHGLAGDSDQLLGSALVFLAYMKESVVSRRESDWAKMILIFPSAACLPNDCNAGTFNSNQMGIDGNGSRYQDAFFELMAHVEANYRVQRPIEIER